VSTLALIVLFSLLGGVLSVLAASTFLLAPDRWRTRLLPHLVSFAVGSMLGAAFLAVLPHAILNPYTRDIHSIGYAVLGGLLLFFLLEKLILWRHHHAHEGHDHEHGCKEGPAGYLILAGDSLHNFIDGIVIAAAFLSDTHLGVVTALAVATHEIPQEVGDFAVLLASGFSRSRAFLFNMLSSLATVVGGVLAYFMLANLQPIIPYVLAVAAASFVYIAVADLMPGLHKRAQPRAALQQLVLIVAGAATIHFAHAAMH
jgi:zinc and cadmium transporter